MPDWQEILRCDGPAVWRTIYRLLNNRADADECFQETFLAALELSRREEVKNWRSLLQRLAAARDVDRIRERCRRRVREQITDWSAVSGNTPQPSQDAEQVADVIADQLPEKPKK